LATGCCENIAAAFANNQMMERRTFKRGLMTRAQMMTFKNFAETAKRSAVGLVALTCGMFF
jgi:hypothetical protein